MGEKCSEEEKLKRSEKSRKYPEKQQISQGNIQQVESNIKQYRHGEYLEKAYISKEESKKPDEKIL